MKILLTIGTHGDEHIGLPVAQKIQALNIPREVLHVHIANPKAFQLQKRFIETDLNRSFPGKKLGKYEERLAHKLSPAIKSADVVIDIHSTTSDLKDAVIVTKLDAETRACIEAIQPKYALLMSATKDNALISQAKVGIAFEYGHDTNKEVIEKITTGLIRLLSHLGVVNIKSTRRRHTTTYFDVINSVERPEGYVLCKGIENYKKVKANEPYATNGQKYLYATESFYPILFGEKKYIDIFGFKAILMR